MKTWGWTLLLLLYAVGIGYLSSRPLEVAQEAGVYHLDKLFHAVEFGLFLFLAWRATGKRLIAAWILTVAFAASDEVHQAFVPMRDASLFDVLADVLGATLVAGVLWRNALLWRVLRTRILERKPQERGR